MNFLREDVSRKQGITTSIHLSALYTRPWLAGISEKARNLTKTVENLASKNEFPNIIQTETEVDDAGPDNPTQYSTVINVVPETRIRLFKWSAKQIRPLGVWLFLGAPYNALRLPGMENYQGIFVSRLEPGGLAETTGLFALNDEIIEVNGVKVAGKSTDQVVDMINVYRSNLIMIVKPWRVWETIVRSSLSKI